MRPRFPRLPVRPTALRTFRRPSAALSRCFCGGWPTRRARGHPGTHRGAQRRSTPPTPRPAPRHDPRQRRAAGNPGSPGRDRRHRPARARPDRQIHRIPHPLLALARHARRSAPTARTRFRPHQLRPPRGRRPRQRRVYLRGPHGGQRGVRRRAGDGDGARPAAEPGRHPGGTGFRRGQGRGQHARGHHPGKSRRQYGHRGRGSARAVGRGRPGGIPSRPRRNAVVPDRFPADLRAGLRRERAFPRGGRPGGAAHRHGHRPA